MTRQEKVQAAFSLRSRGRTTNEIADALRVSPHSVRDYIWDPDGSKARARKQSYAGTCEDCGAPTSGSDGRDRAPRRCFQCSTRYLHENRYWNQQRVIEAIQLYVAKNGRIPAATEWLKGTRGTGFPNCGTVQREFGTWNKGIAAAGFTPNPRGKYERTPQSQARLSASIREGHRKKQAQRFPEATSFSNMYQMFMERQGVG